MSVHPAPAFRAHSPNLDRQNHAQAAHIHAMLARRVPEQDIAAAVGCTLARVRAVAAQPAPDPNEHPQPRHPSMAGLTVSQLLAATDGHDDPRIAALNAHIRGDLGVLRDLYADACARADHAARLAELEAHADGLHAANLARHRRHTDGVSA